MSTSAARRGRPRDASIDERALQAARELLVEEGYAATTIARVAERAGVQPSAVYRRWSSPVELVRDAAYTGLAPGRVRPSGDLRKDLTRFLRAYDRALGAPLHRAALPALVDTDGASDADGSDAWLRRSVRPQFRAVLDAAPPGSVDPALDPDDAFDVVLGLALVRAVVPEGARRRPPIGHTVDVVLRVLRPPA